MCPLQEKKKPQGSGTTMGSQTTFEENDIKLKTNTIIRDHAPFARGIIGITISLTLKGAKGC